MGKHAKTRRSPKKSARAASPQKDVDVSGEVSEDEEQALATNTKGKDVVPSTPATSSSAGPDPQLSHDSALALILAALQRMEAENKAMRLRLSALEQSGVLAAPEEDVLGENIVSSDEERIVPEDIVYMDDEVASTARDNAVIDPMGSKENRRRKPHVDEALIQAKIDYIPIFSGDPSSDVEDWISQVIEVARAAGWTECKLAQLVRPRLAGRAARLLSTLPAAATWAEITQALRRQFVDAQSRQDLFSTLYSFTQKPTEPVWDFHCRFQRLLLRWPGQVSAEHQLAAFRNGLLPPWKKAVVSLGAKTLPEAFEIAERNELASQLEHEGKRKLTRDVYTAQVFEDPCVNDEVSTSTVNERLVVANLATPSTASNLDQGAITKATLFQSNLEILARLDKLIAMKEQKPKLRASALQPRPAAGARNSRAPDGKLVCYRCRQVGHLARDCPVSKNGDTSSSATRVQVPSQTSTSSTTSSGGRSN